MKKVKSKKNEIIPIEKIMIGNWVKLSKEMTDLDDCSCSFCHCDTPFVKVRNLKDGNADTIEEFNKGLDYLILWDRYNPFSKHVGHVASGCGIQYIEFIELSNDWLTAFGFEKREGSQWYRGDVRVSMSMKTPSIFYEDKLLDMCRVILKDNFVHTLQNTWSILFDEQLKICDEILNQ